MRVDSWQAEGDNIALEFANGETMSYGELQTQIQQRATELSTLTTQVVMLPMRRKLRTIIDVFALVSLNKVFIPLEAEADLAKVKKLSQHFAEVIYLDEMPKLFHGKSASLDFPPETLFVGFTSGTTGAEKGFIRNHSSWVASFESFSQVKQFPSEKVMCFTPLNYTLGLYTLFETLYLGKTYLLDSVSVAALSTQVKQHVEVYGVPSSLRIAFQKEHVPLTATVLFILSGEPVPRDLVTVIKATYPQSQLLTFYGTSETSFISYQFLPGAKKSGATLFPQVNLTIHAPDDQQVGEIYIKSPFNFAGYLEHGKFKPALRHIQTGDFGKYDGTLHYLGRRDDQINRGGEKIFASSLEEILRKHPGIWDVQISKKADAVLGEKVVATISWQDTPLMIGELNHFISQQGVRKMRVDELVAVTQFSLNNSGKKARKGEAR